MILATFAPQMRINIYVDARFVPQKPAQGMVLTASGPKLRINIYVDAPFKFQKQAET